MLNIQTFKLLCFKAGTTKASEIHHYFVKLEFILQETILEECIELKQQLENHVLISHNQQDILRENTTLKQFPANTQCVYYGKIDNKSEKGEPLVKFGCSNFLCDRVKSHKKTFDNFFLIHAFKVDNAQQIENAIKYHPVLSKLRRSLTINETRFTELIAYDQTSKMTSPPEKLVVEARSTSDTTTFENLDEIIKDIIKKIEYSPENYTMLLNENETLKKKIHTLNREIVNLQKNKYCQGSLNTQVDDLQSTNTSDEIHVNSTNISVNNDIRTFKHVRKYNKSKDGKYHVHGFIYDKLMGTREEVWNNIAFHTSGELQKHDLMISTSVNNYGKIVSKAKHHVEISLKKNRFEKTK